MSGVKRYNTELEKDGGLGLPSLTMRSSSIGSWVEYKDYAALEDKCAARDEKLRMINELTGAAEQANKLAQEATGRLIQERNALAAENAWLKNAITAVSKTSEECEINGDELKYVVEPSEFDALTDLLDETPATDAFLAEVRASARNYFIGRIEWIIRNECNPDKTEAIINELQNFSDELKLEAAQ